jgi:hypothetical protein
LKIQAELDTGCYPTGIKETDQELQDVALEPAAFHGEWNYTKEPDKSFFTSPARYGAVAGQLAGHAMWQNICPSTYHAENNTKLRRLFTDGS